MLDVLAQLHQRDGNRRSQQECIYLQMLGVMQNELHEMRLETPSEFSVKNTNEETQCSCEKLLADLENFKSKSEMRTTRNSCGQRNETQNHLRHKLEYRF